MQLARIAGWRLAHFRPAINRSGHWSTPMQGNPGFPDLVLVRPPRVLFVELKSEKGKLSEHQRDWIADLRGCPHIDVRVWFPSDWDSEIVPLLSKDAA